MSLQALAFVPSAPLLLAGLGGGPADLLLACDEAIRALQGLSVVVLGAARTPGLLAGEVDATPWGAPGSPTQQPLPLAHAVGASLLRGQPHRHWGVPGDLPVLGAPTGLLVVADGSARRTEKAPGHLDDRAAAFDERVSGALADADPAALLDTDPRLASDLLAAGLDAWRVAAELAAREVRPEGTAPRGWSGRRLYSAAPYGVGYVVATWIPRGAAGAVPPA